MLAEEDLPYPKHDSPHSEHHGPKTPRPEHKRHDRPRYEQDGGCQAKHSRTRWVSPSHQSLIIMPPTRARCELRRITLPRTRVHKARSGRAGVPRPGPTHGDPQRVSAGRCAAPGEAAPRRTMPRRPPLRHIKKAMMNAHTANSSRPTSLMIDGTKPS